MNTEKGTQNRLSKFYEFFLQEHIQEIQKQAQVMVKMGQKHNLVLVVWQPTQIKHLTFTIIGMSFSSTVTFITIKLVFFSICSIGENDFEKMPFCEMLQRESWRVDGSQTLIL